MSGNKAIFDFLATKENLDIAAEIADHLAEFRKEQRSRFWNSFNRISALRVSKIEPADWSFEAFPVGSKDKRSLLRPGRNFSYKHHVQMVFASTGSQDQLFWGVQWNKEYTDFHDATYENLKSALRHRNIDLTYKGYVYWGHTDYAIYDSEFMVRLYHDPDHIVGEVVDRYLNLFMELRPLMEAVNHSVNDAG
jgi:hypothetical protein